MLANAVSQSAVLLFSSYSQQHNLITAYYVCAVN